MAKNEEQPLYRVLARSFIGNSIVEEGAEVVYHGEPGSNLEPLNDVAERAKAGRKPRPRVVHATADGPSDLA